MKCDSQVVVNQVKGVYLTKNFRLVELIKIVHALAFKFKSMGLDYIPREENSVADALAKEAAKTMVSLTKKPYKIEFRLETIMNYQRKKPF